MTMGIIYSIETVLVLSESKEKAFIYYLHKKPEINDNSIFVWN